MKSVSAALMMLLLTTALSAQVQYTDIEPDTLIADNNVAPGQYELDLDGDGSVDFFFMHFYYPVPVYVLSIYTQYFQTHEILTTMDSKVAALERLEQIDESRNFWTCTAQGGQSTGLSFADEWRGSEDRFIGLRVFDGQHWKYGWVQAAVAADESSITLRGYAVQMSADTPIIAGETGVSAVAGRTEPAAPRIVVEGRTVSIDAGLPGRLHASIHDILGKPRMQRSIDGTRLSLDLSPLSDGIYFLRVLSGGRETIRRVSLTGNR